MQENHTIKTYMGHYQSWKSSPKYSFTQKSLNVEILAVYRAYRPYLYLSRHMLDAFQFRPRIRFLSHVKLKATNFLKTFYNRKLLQSLKIVNLKSLQYTDRTRTVMWKCNKTVRLSP